MRNIHYIFFLLIIVFSCNEESRYCDNVANELKSGRVIRDLQTAESWAEQSLLFLGPQTKEETQRKIESYEVVLRPGTKTASSSSDTLLYVFNFSDSSGFSIIAANENEEPIIAIAESGHYVPGEPTGVGGFDLYVDGLCERLSSRWGPIAQVWYEYVMVGDSVSRDVGVRWGQGNIYGDYCPNHIAGCAPTAIAQILAYHQYPSSFIASVNMGGDYLAGESVSLNWTGIKTHIDLHTDSLSCNQYHKQISALLREIGCAANTNYASPNSSSTSTNNVPGAFEHFGYTTTSPILVNSNNIPTLTSCIKSFGPVYMRGDRVENDTLHGHAWVADGYKDYGYYRDKYSLEIVGPDPVLVEHLLIRESHMLHINWGWNGDCNGFFNFNIYDIDNAVIYDDTHNNSGRNYDTNVKMIVVYPVNPYL